MILCTRQTLLFVAATLGLATTVRATATDTTWTLSGCTFNDGGTVSGSAIYHANGSWTWDITSSFNTIPNSNFVVGWHWTETGADYENNNVGENVFQFITQDYQHQLWFHTFHGSTAATFWPALADSFDLSIPNQAVSSEIGSPGGSRWLVAGTLIGTSSTIIPPTVPSIDTSVAYYTQTQLAAGQVLPDFKGGTLRCDHATTLSNNFTVQSGGGTFDLYGYNEFLSGGSLTGAGGWVVTDGAHTTNASAVATLLLDEPAAYLGATKINSGASVKFTGSSNVHGGFVDGSALTLNGTLTINGFSQMLGSLAGTDPTAKLDLGAGGKLTISGNTSTTFAGAIANTNPYGLTLEGSGTLTLSGTNTYTGYTVISPGTTLALSGSGSIASSFQVNQYGTLDISATTSGASLANIVGNGPVVLGSKTLTLTSPVSTFNGVISGIGGGVKVAAGSQTLAAANLYTGTTTVSSGANLSVTGTLAAASSVSASGSMSFAANTSTGMLTRKLAAVSITSTGKVIIAAPSAAANRTVLVAGALTLGGSTNAWQGLVDLTMNDMIIRGTTTATVLNQIKQAFNGGAWNGTAGITSSSVAGSNPSMALGYGSFSGTFDGQALTTSDVAIKYTLAGDANLDSAVNFSDLVVLAQNYNVPGKWSSGDFNYDGVVNFSDLVIIAQNYNKSIPAAQIISIGGDSFAGDWALARSLVPEPCSWGVLAAGSLLAVRRRRGRRLQPHRDGMPSI